MLFFSFDYIERKQLVLQEFASIDFSNVTYAIFQITTISLYYLQLILFIYLFIRLYFAAKVNMSGRIILKNLVVSWLRIFITSVILYELLMLITTVLLPKEIYEVLVQLYTLIILIFLGIFGINQTTIEIQTLLRKTHVMEDNTEVETQKYIVTEDEKEDLIDCIKKTLQEKKIYTNPNLKIDQFAKKIHASPRKLSIVINEVTGENFINFLNKYRVEEAKKLLLRNRSAKNLEEIYLQCGFNSRSTFFRAFKSVTGLTPIEFKTKNLN